MPHRKNAKGDIGTAKTFSDTYDADNIYLSEEGWVYRHFKNTERTLWWDEILVAGQVKPEMKIHDVDNGVGVDGSSQVYNDGVALTNPLKLGTIGKANFQTGDGVNDYRYSDHMYQDLDGTIKKLDKVVVEKNSTQSATGFDQIAWESINVTGEVKGDISTQIPDGWDGTDPVQGVTKPHNDTVWADEPPYDGDDYQSVNYNTVAPDVMPGIPPQIIVGEFEDGSGGGTAGQVPESSEDPDAGIPPELPSDTDDDDTTPGSGVLPIPQN